jgi:hypothetical protein
MLTRALLHLNVTWVCGPITPLLLLLLVPALLLLLLWPKLLSGC